MPLAAATINRQQRSPDERSESGDNLVIRSRMSLRSCGLRSPLHWILLHEVYDCDANVSQVRTFPHLMSI